MRKKSATLLSIFLLMLLVVMSGCKDEKGGDSASDEDAPAAAAPRKVAMSAAVPAQIEPVGERLAAPEGAASDALLKKGPGEFSFGGAYRHLRSGHDTQAALKVAPFFSLGLAELIYAQLEPEQRADFKAFVEATGVDISTFVESALVLSDIKDTAAPKTEKSLSVWVFLSDGAISPRLVDFIIARGAGDDSSSSGKNDDDKDFRESTIIVVGGFTAEVQAKIVASIKKEIEEEEGDRSKFISFDATHNLIFGEDKDGDANFLYFWERGFVYGSLNRADGDLEAEARGRAAKLIAEMDALSKADGATASSDEVPVLMLRGSIEGNEGQVVMTVGDTVEIGARIALLPHLAKKIAPALENYGQFKTGVVQNIPLNYKGLVNNALEGSQIVKAGDDHVFSVIIEAAKFKEYLPKGAPLPKP